MLDGTDYLPRELTEALGNTYFFEVAPDRRRVVLFLRFPGQGNSGTELGIELEAGQLTEFITSAQWAREQIN